MQKDKQVNAFKGTGYTWGLGVFSSAYREICGRMEAFKRPKVYTWVLDVLFSVY